MKTNYKSHEVSVFKHFYINFKITGSDDLINIFNLETDIQLIFRSSFSNVC